MNDWNVLVAGYFDQHMRQSLFTAWSNHMQQTHIQFKSDIARIEVGWRPVYLLNIFPIFLLDVCIFRSTLSSRTNTVGLKCPSVYPSIRPSTETLFDFYEIWYVVRGP